MGILSSIGKGISSAFKGATSAFSQASPMLSFGAGLLGDFMQHSDSNKQLEMQVAENEKNRQFNALQAQKNRDFQLEMFNKQNAYNDPKAVISRMMRAGVNPAVALGGGFADSAAAPIGSAASSSGSVGTGLPSYTGLQSLGPQFAQIENIQADSDLKQAQAENLRKQTSWIDIINSNVDSLQKSDLALKVLLPDSELKKRELTVAQIEQIQTATDDTRKRWAFIAPQLENIKQENLKLSIVNKNLDAKQKAELHNLIIAGKKMLSDIHLNEAQVYQLQIMTPAILNKLAAETRLSNNNADIANYDAIQKGRENEILRQYYDKYKSQLADMKFEEFQAAISALQRQGGAVKAADWVNTSVKVLGIASGLVIGGFFGGPPGAAAGAAAGAAVTSSVAIPFN